MRIPNANEIRDNYEFHEYLRENAKRARTWILGGRFNKSDTSSNSWVEWMIEVLYPDTDEVDASMKAIANGATKLAKEAGLKSVNENSYRKWLMAMPLERRIEWSVKVDKLMFKHAKFHVWDNN